MLQEAIKKQPGNTAGISFQQKSTALSLIITSSVTTYYFINMWPMRPLALASNALPDGFGTLVLGAVALFISTQIILQIVLAISAGSIIAKATAYEKMAALKATRNAYLVLTVGIFAAIGTVFLEGLTPFCTANIAILAFALAEIVKFTSQLFYNQRYQE